MTASARRGTAAPEPASERTVSERIRAIRDKASPAELAVIAILLGDYPMAGLVPVVQLATSAGVSAPSVLRFVGKLGFSGYPDFRKALRNEVSARLFSPVDNYPSGLELPIGGGESGVCVKAQLVFGEALRTTFAQLDPRELERLVALLAEPRRSIMIIGGRFSGVLAQHLGNYLQMLRPRVRIVGASEPMAAALLDVDKSTVVVVFDYRRYQQSTIDWSLAARRRGAHLVLITDQYLSPLASHVQSMLTNSAAGPPPFDSMTSGFALVETIISMMASKLGRAARARLGRFEEYRVDEEGPDGRIPASPGVALSGD